MGKRPYVFIGSSSEHLPIAAAIQQNLDYPAECQIWSQGVFGLSGSTLQSLVTKLDDFDFGILVVTPVDLVESRGEKTGVPRDNVLLELGMFIGHLGIDRTFMVCDREAEMKLPSDLAGITPALFQQPQAGNMQTALGAACTQIKEAIAKVGCRKPDRIRVEVNPYFDSGEAGSFKGIEVTIINQGKDAFPPFTLSLVHSKAGSGPVFTPQVDGQLWPDQERRFQCVTWRSDKRNWPHDRFTRARLTNTHCTLFWNTAARCYSRAARTARYLLASWTSRYRSR
jgi:hypothetical protein